MLLPLPLRYCAVLLTSALLRPTGQGQELQTGPPTPVQALRLAAQTSEVHGVGVYRPAQYRVEVETASAWPKLVEAIHSRIGPGGRIRDFLGRDDDLLALLADENTRAHVGDAAPPGDSVGVSVHGLRAGMHHRLARIIESPEFYTPDAFKGVTLSPDLKEMLALGKKRTFHQTAVMNRKLLEAAFPNTFTETTERFRTIRVDVLDGKAVLLVLSSHDPCRWEVRVRDGATVTGVLLCGYYPQEVAGVGKAPVFSRTYFGPDGKLWRERNKYFHGYNQKKESFKTFAGSVKDLLGKEFTKFQGENQPGPESEPYFIRPVAER